MEKIFLLLLVFYVGLFANSSVWKVSKDNNHIYIGGTIHLLSKDDYPLPNEFTKAYNNSEIIVFEANLGKMGSLEYQKLLQEKSIYKNGENIEKYLSRNTLKDLKYYLQKEGFSSDMMLKFRPGVLTMLISLKELRALGLSEEGVDVYFENMAKRDRKQLLYLEEVEEQIDFITTMGLGNEENYIKYSMNEIKNISRDINKMRYAWRKGNLNLIGKKDIFLLRNKFPKIYQNLLVKRNKNWMPKIEKMFSTKEIEYVLFGALHLSGEDGILYKLKKLGYKIEQL